MLQTVELPTGIANLAASLSDVDGDALTLRIRRVTVNFKQIKGNNLEKRVMVSNLQYK